MAQPNSRSLPQHPYAQHSYSPSATPTVHPHAYHSVLTPRHAAPSHSPSGQRCSGYPPPAQYHYAQQFPYTPSATSSQPLQTQAWQHPYMTGFPFGSVPQQTCHTYQPQYVLPQVYYGVPASARSQYSYPAPGLSSPPTQANYPNQCQMTQNRPTQGGVNECFTSTTTVCAGMPTAQDTTSTGQPLTSTASRPAEEDPEGRPDVDTPFVRAMKKVLQSLEESDEIDRGINEDILELRSQTLLLQQRLLVASHPGTDQVRTMRANRESELDPANGLQIEHRQDTLDQAQRDPTEPDDEDRHENI